jgi:CotS family spore coat protein
LNEEQIIRIIETNYNLKVKIIKKIKNVYRINTVHGDYCLKVIKYGMEHFLFILGAIKHLQNNGFNSTPQIIRKLDGMEYLKLENSNAFLTPWINSRQCDYDNLYDVTLATSKLAEMHIKSQGFILKENMKPRIGWYKWVDNFITKNDEILDFRHRIDKKNKKSEFDLLYLKNMENELERADKAILDLSLSSYLEKMQSEIEKHGFCHHDYAHHNVLIGEKDNVNIIDFDFCILDSHLHDLSSLIIRVMKNGKWDIRNALHILNVYNLTNNVDKLDIPIMAAFMEYPQEYWQIGIQYYWEKQPWGEEFFLKKLEKIYEDEFDRQDFLEEFSILKYKS